MQAAVVPAIHGKWEVKEVPTPHPATNQVLIKIHASGLCYTDVHITEGLLPTAAFPRTHRKLIGGLGHLAVQYSKAAGFYTLAITHSKDKEDLAGKLGADLIVSNGEALKQAGGADIILVTGNSYKAASESLK